MNFVYKISKLQDRRFIWILMSVIMLSFVAIAYGFFQKYLYMQPCKQCIFIRISMLIIALGGIIAAIKPTDIFLKFCGYILGIGASIAGIIFSTKLNTIKEMIQNNKEIDISNISGCAVSPAINLNTTSQSSIMPNLFDATGGCGYDSPVVPPDTALSDLQNYFVNLYSDGWYLVPSAKFGSMASCTTFAYSLTIFLLCIMLICYIYTKFKPKMKF